MNHFTAEDFEKLLKGWITELINFVPALVGAIVAFIAGRYIIRFLLNLTKKLMIRREVDVTLQTFLLQLIKWTLHIALFLIIIQIIGVPATQFFAILASAGVAIGLALQGSLSNFAGGIMILIFKPFKVGDNIEAKGERGTVKRIGLVSTTLNKFNNEEVIIPNGPLFGDSIINYTREDKRRVKVLVGIGYNSDLQKAKEILLDIAKSDKRAFEEPAPSVFVEELADSSVNISVRFWCNNDDYWDCYFNAIESVKTRFDAEGIEIPFPQRVLNIVSDTSKS
ncbi:MULTISPECIES: mechanosensitive ion channel family protein [Capnocytophaga]|uniref:Small-conductance mechanosensitive channel n=2 Tax=Capnocytophaga TaxID=1016 RepID=A0A0B7HP52_9FLAO|nr:MULTISPECIES: mechanosensitive ion channel domain-containing protein [Capnocytophaga]ATA92101.1 mechanosensitive ion channel protein [Capnocytophaga canimorsus]ATA94184.1 mechanosensitive ion channel protein [Capnocytophaga canimorsus]AYW37513.1 mechanosensitive ion channel family protein [Capnocytophaga canimorsus]CEN35492.1 Small-conductance mechanosensitive channel [Capnocytophaga cynodegmi]CEN40434.1 Small-conductance mechanosensitive channel [Capnocytophaga cynodegmi]